MSMHMVYAHVYTHAYTRARTHAHARAYPRVNSWGGEEGAKRYLDLEMGAPSNVNATGLYSYGPYTHGLHIVMAYIVMAVACRG